LQTMQLGRSGPEVSVIGLSCRALALGREDSGIATIHAAAERGVTLLDTGDFYGAGGQNEMLVREALWSLRRDRLFVAVGFGIQRAPDGSLLGVDARPASVKNFLTYSLRRLGTDYVDLYRPACTDPAVPIEETIGAIADLVQAGYVRHIGLSNVSDQTIRRAHAVHPITALQAEYSLLSRGAERQVLPTLRELGIGFVADGCGRQSAELLGALDDLAEERDVTPIRLAVGWILAQGGIVPLISARGPDELADALGALAIDLTSQDVARIESAIRGMSALERLVGVNLSLVGDERHAVG
jgi:aryl-alcohol dehydrogenase-like predicted oxidoreductase